MGVLNNRLLRDLKSDFGKYLSFFILIVLMISIVSGFNVQNTSVGEMLDESIEKYTIEDGNFVVSEELNNFFVNYIEKKGELKLYENFYKNEALGEATLRIYQTRQEVDLQEIVEGSEPKGDSEIGIDQLFAKKANISVGDKITIDNKEFTVSALVCLSDYSALFEKQSDMMFDISTFGVAICSESAFNSISNTHINYCYSWLYNETPADDNEAYAKLKSLFTTDDGETYDTTDSDFIISITPRFSNMCIQSTFDDVDDDGTMINVFYYILLVIIAFVFTISINHTIERDSNIIGTLKASGYSTKTIKYHYLAMPMFVTLVACVVGNIVGYTVLKDYFCSMVYESYSLPQFQTIFNKGAFIKTTVLPLIMIYLINSLSLRKKLKISPIKFLRHDIEKRRVKAHLKLSTSIPFKTRFRTRIVFQNLKSYLTIFVGVFFAVFLMLFALVFNSIIQNNGDVVKESMFCDYQYVLSGAVETENADAEKVTFQTLNTDGSVYKQESVTIYGIQENSQYLDIDFANGDIVISSALANKYKLDVGDEFTLEAQFEDTNYTFTVSEIYEYNGSISMFLPQSYVNELFEYDADYFNGYISNSAIDDIDESKFLTTITEKDLTKLTRQLQDSLSAMLTIFVGFGAIVFALVIYILSKIVIEKNSKSISLAKILGYSDLEINSLYLAVTSIVVMISFIVSIPLVDGALQSVLEMAMGDYSGYLPYVVDKSVYVTTVIMGISIYFILAIILIKKIKKIPLDVALKNAE